MTHDRNPDESPFTVPVMEEIGPVYRDLRCVIGWHQWGAPLVGMRSCKREHCSAKKSSPRLARSLSALAAWVVFVVPPVVGLAVEFGYAPSHVVLGLGLCCLWLCAVAR